MALPESLYDDIFNHPELRIPPLQDPFPELSASSRLPPLEPTARLGAHVDGEAAKLTGRRKALAEAKSIEEEESNELRPIQPPKASRRRPKLHEQERIADFVQLPKPKTKPKEAKPPPFQPVSEINELHEPPPSAALFPRINPNDTNNHEHRRLSSLSPIIHAQVEEKNNAHGKKARRRTSYGPPAKRLYLRERNMWTEEETEYLARGVAIYGIGKWKKILNHPGFKFHEGRTYVDLKDRFRSKYGGKASNIPDRLTSNTNLPALVSRPVGDGSRNPSEKSKSNGKIKRKGAWSEAEDNALVIGYEKHGFSWAKIANDPNLTFNNRTGPQIRDRFRQLFPTSYGEGRAMKERSNEKVKNKSASNSISTSRETLPSTGALNSTGKWTEAPGHEKGDTTNPASEQQMHEPTPKVNTQPPTSNTVMGLLNDQLDENRPSSSLRLDEDWGQSVTLPPLMWEDMATRPLFDFDG